MRNLQFKILHFGQNSQLNLIYSLKIQNQYFGEFNEP